MARKRIARVAALNIKTHPHSSELYGKLFDRAVAGRLKAKVRGERMGTVVSVWKIPGEPQWRSGSLYMFTNLDPFDTWFDEQTRKPIEQDQKAEPIVPTNLKPHLRQVPFVFSCKDHRLFFCSSDISPRSACKFFDALLNQPVISDGIGEVDVSIETKPDSITKILSMPSLRTLCIDISLHNDDAFAGQKKRFLERMDARNVRREKTELTARDTNGLKPDDDIRIMMEIATSNGRVIASGKNLEGEKEIIETDEHPLTYVVRYDPDYTEIASVIAQASVKLLEVIRRNHRG